MVLTGVERQVLNKHPVPRSQGHRRRYCGMTDVESLAGLLMPNVAIRFIAHGRARFTHGDRKGKHHKEIMM